MYVKFEGANLEKKSGCGTKDLCEMPIGQKKMTEAL